MSNRPTIALVIGSFHKNSCEAMVSAALAAAAEAGLDVREQVWVPGSMEKPLAVKRLLTRNNIDGAVVLGIIERGETAHGRVMGTTTGNRETSWYRHFGSRDIAGPDSTAACALCPGCSSRRTRHAG